MTEELLKLENLKVSIRTKKGEIYPVDGINLEIPKKSIVGLVGESGCGKSMTAMSVMGLLPVGGKRTEAKDHWRKNGDHFPGTYDKSESSGSCGKTGGGSVEASYRPE